MLVYGVIWNRLSNRNQWVQLLEEYTPSIQRYSLPKPSKSEPRGQLWWKSRDAIPLCGDTQRMRGDFGVLSGELKTEPSTGKDR